MNLDKTLNIILALAILALASAFAIKQTKSNTTKETIPMTKETGEIVYENILTRSSVRSYTDKKISKDLLEKLVRAGMAAPTGMNKQPWHFIVVENREKLDKLAELLPNAKMLKGAAAGIVVLGDAEKSGSWVQDTSAATENILLAAHGFGLGAVWTGVYPADQRIIAVDSILKLDSKFTPLCVIAIGYPDSEPNIKDKWVESNLSWQ